MKIKFKEILVYIYELYKNYFDVISSRVLQINERRENILIFYTRGCNDWPVYSKFWKQFKSEGYLVNTQVLHFIYVYISCINVSGTHTSSCRDKDMRSTWNKKHMWINWSVSQSSFRLSKLNIILMRIDFTWKIFPIFGYVT